MSCTRPAITAADSAAFELTVRTDALGTQTNTATIGAPTSDPDTTNNAASADVLVVPAADLALAKTGPAQVAADGVLTYTLQVTNQGPSEATGVTRDRHAAGRYHVPLRAEPGQGTCTHTAGVVTCALGALPAAGTVTVTVTAHAEFTVAGQTPINTAAVTGNEVDVNPADNTAGHPVTVGPAADVSVVKSAPARVPAENQMLYTLQVANAGPQTATAVTVTDTLPDGLRLIHASPSQGQCSADGRKVICELGDIHSGAKANVQLTVEVAAGTAGSRLLNTANVTASEPDPDPADNTSEAATEVDLPVRPAGEPVGHQGRGQSP